MESAVPLWMPGKKPYGSLDGLIERPEVIIGERQTHLRVRITDYRQKQGNRGCSELSVRARLKEHAEKKQQKVTKEVRHGSRPGKKKSANRISYNTQREHPWKKKLGLVKLDQKHSRRKGGENRIILCAVSEIPKYSIIYPAKKNYVSPCAEVRIEVRVLRLRLRYPRHP
jgi:hypothetical protein